MFAGAGGEILYWPYKSRIAFEPVPLTLNRGTTPRFGLLDFSVMTGHVSAYWATPFYNYDVAVHAGRYLAKDVGATFEVRRPFVTVGRWVFGPH